MNGTRVPRISVLLKGRSATMKMQSFAWVLWVATGLASGLGHAVAQQTMVASTRPVARVQAVSFDVPAQSLGDAIAQAAQQADVNVVWWAEVGEGLKAPRLEGSFTPQRAFAALLINTPLRADFVDAHTVVIRSAAAQAPAAPEGPPPRPQTSDQRHSGDDRELPSTRADKTPATPSNSPGAAVDKRSQGGSETTGTPEIIVTAEKRAERLIETPLSVSVVSTSDLTKGGATQLRDYASSIPGLNILTNGAGDMIVSMRGLTVGTDVGPTVGIYVDDVPYGSSSSLTFGYTLGFDPSPLDLERIEVLKGPQGTLYGASSMGGVIKYITPKPSLDQFSAQAQAGVASIDHGGVSYQTGAAVNVPITDIVAARFSAFESHDGGYIDNIALGRPDINRSDTYGGRADLLILPSSRLSIRVAGFLQDIGRSGLGDATYTLTGATPYGSLGQYRPTPEPFHQSFRLASGTVDYDFDWAALTSITSYQEGRTQWDVDVTQLLGGAAKSIFHNTYSGISDANRGPTDKFVQEVRLAGGQNQPLEWVIGAFYTHEMSSLDSEYFLFDATGNLTADNLSTVSVPESYKEYAGFGTVTWHLSSRFDVSGGLRDAHNSDRVTQMGSGILSGSRPTATSSDSVLTYLADARYHLSRDATLYARYATGYRPGGPNYLVFDPTTHLPVGPPSFKPDKLQSYEIGFKGETPDRRFSIDAALFLNDWKDIQAFSVQGSVAFRANGPKARTQGGEITIATRPIEGLELGANYSYVDAKLLAASPDLHAADGERLPTTPRSTVNGTADYTFTEQGLRPTIGMTVQYVSDRKAGFGNTYILPDYTTFDARAGLSIKDVDVQLYGRNLLDERGQLSAYISGSPRIAIIPPRTVGILATARF